ncbi:H-NS histone family protein [Burkholderia cepacia]|uniref:H-NS histone family protein n=1 Tax=Burkholderia cepacia TaxID=292 RepID=UPI002AB72B8B|nr:H-NS histone family protein [Burkholderia cepacia]
MATYLELKAQADALAQQAEEARLAELESIVTTMREQIAEYGITADQLFGRRRKSGAKGGGPVPPKYRDPKTGATWSGRGKAPRWISGAKNRGRFLIGETE